MMMGQGLVILQAAFWLGLLDSLVLVAIRYLTVGPGNASLNVFKTMICGHLAFVVYIWYASHRFKFRTRWMYRMFLRNRDLYTRQSFIHRIKVTIDALVIVFGIWRSCVEVDFRPFTDKEMAQRLIFLIIMKEAFWMTCVDGETYLWPLIVTLQMALICYTMPMIWAQSLTLCGLLVFVSVHLSRRHI